MNTRILLVDDDKDFTTAIATRLRTVGFEVETASNPLTAISLLDKFTPDAICLDVAMPTGDGMSVCEFLKGDARAAGIPVIICTGQKGADVQRRCDELGARYIHKSPYLSSELQELIGEVIGSAEVVATD